VVLIDGLFFVGCRSKQGSATLDAYLSQKHDKLLAKLLPPDTYCKKSSLAIVDGFAVEITDAQVGHRRASPHVWMCSHILNGHH
jgi:hypothetical protein